MKCRDCGTEVANIGALNKHRASCPAYAKRVGTDTEEISSGERSANPVIPWERVDPSLKVLSVGTPLTFRVIGVIRENGIEVKEVHPDRR